MIVSVTMNPSVDISYPLNFLNIDSVNRVENVSKTAGGKGLNVSRVIKQLNHNVIATGILGGHLGKYIVNQLDEEAVSNRFLEIDKESRNCIAILHDGKQTEILESGPTLNKNEGNEFIKLFEELIKEASVVTISGSLPNGLSTDYYQKLLEKSKNNAIKVLVDTSGDTLSKTLLSEYKPYLIKPNRNELNDLLHREINLEIEELKEALSHSMFNGVEVVLVSMGADGAFAKISNEYYKISIPEITVVNPVGSGDATIAGLAVAIEQNLPWNEVLKVAMTTGMLNTMEEKTGYINANNFEEYFDQVRVEKIV